MDIPVPPEIAELMGEQTVTVEEVLQTLENTESHWNSGDCGRVDPAELMALTRMRVAIATQAFGASSKQAKAALYDLGHHYFFASKHRGANQWAEAVRCFELSGTRLAQSDLVEARKHLT